MDRVTQIGAKTKVIFDVLCSTRYKNNVKTKQMCFFSSLLVENPGIRIVLS